jgi:hypothetical protein
MHFWLRYAAMQQRRGRTGTSRRADPITFDPVFSMNDFPSSVAFLVDELTALPGAVAIALGGSRAAGSHAADSDWDIGLYYRGSIDLAALAARGDVYPPGSWGRLMNGGAWLQCDGHRVDVLLRDLDVVEHWQRRAEAGEFDVDALLGYIAGAPTYMLAAELASCRVLRGELPAAPYPGRLVAAGPPRWRFCSGFSAAYARAHAKRGNAIAAAGQMAKAVLEEAHAVLCERGEWVCNEKRLIDAAGLADVQSFFAMVPTQSAALTEWVEVVAGRLGIESGRPAPWE